MREIALPIKFEPEAITPTQEQQDAYYSLGMDIITQIVKIKESGLLVITTEKNLLTIH